MPKSKSSSTPRQTQAQKTRAREIKARRQVEVKALDKQLRDARKALIKAGFSGSGFYAPKSTKLTRYRKSRWRQLVRQFGEYTDAARFTIVAPPPAAKKKVLKTAKRAGMVTSRKGVVVEKSHPSESVRLVRDKGSGLYVVEAGKPGDLGYERLRPIAGIDEVSVERERIKKLAKRFKLKNDEHLRIRVNYPGGPGMGRHIFTDVDALVDALSAYDRGAPDEFAQFLGYITLEKVTVAQHVRQRRERDAEIAARHKIHSKEYRIRLHAKRKGDEIIE